MYTFKLKLKIKSLSHPDLEMVIQDSGGMVETVSADMKGELKWFGMFKYEVKHTVTNEVFLQGETKISEKARASIKTVKDVEVAKVMYSRETIMFILTEIIKKHIEDDTGIDLDTYFDDESTETEEDRKKLFEKLTKLKDKIKESTVKEVMVAKKMLTIVSEAFLLEDFMPEHQWDSLKESFKKWMEDGCDPKDIKKLNDTWNDDIAPHPIARVMQKQYDLDINITTGDDIGRLPRHMRN